LLDNLLGLRNARRLALVMVVVSFAWMSADAFRAYPDYIPYMNQLASAHPHWWYLSDSNVEWGDDGRALAEYLHARGETEVVGSLSGGWGSLAQYDITYHEILLHTGKPIPNTRYVAIGASFLNGSTVYVAPDENGKVISEEQRVNYFAAYRARQPEAIFGGSIYLFRERELPGCKITSLRRGA
jgi:hypothetical protein